MAISKITGVITANGTTNSISSIDVPVDTIIIAILAILTGEYQTPAAGSYSLIGELSFLSTNQISGNDSRGSLMEISVAGTVLTSGGHGLHANSHLEGVSIPVSAGERLHIHGVSSAATLLAQLTFMIYTEEGVKRRSARRG